MPVRVKKMRINETQWSLIGSPRTDQAFSVRNGSNARLAKRQPSAVRR